MSLQRIILEMGTGNDLYGEDYTKAAVRAVQDCLHHSSISLFRSMGIDHDTMHVEVTIGTQKPEAVDIDVIAKQIPFGTVTVNTVKGGLNVSDPVQNTVTVIASAAVAARQAKESLAFALVMPSKRSRNAAPDSVSFTFTERRSSKLVTRSTRSFLASFSTILDMGA